MTSTPSAGRGYRVSPGELTAQVAKLATLGESTSGLVTSASRLAERLPMLGTAPPALHLAQRLRTAAGETGLTGEVGAANTELSGFHQALRETVANYLDREQDIAATLRSAEGDAG
ncbi:MAG TPA: hypothetical protein VHX38_07200 [Pseudonocardiaceae bacterium]|nr:hypothetical protein [Pseudonocardiaceae bacterium]